MKYYVVLSFVIGYLYITVSGTTDETFNSATNVETSFSNATNVEELPSNATNLEESSENGTALEVPLQNIFPYLIQNETDPILEHGIKGGFNKVKTRITNIGNKVKNRITGIGSGGNGKSGNGRSGNYIHPRITRNNGSDMIELWIFLGILGIAGVFYLVAYILEKKNKSGTSLKEEEGEVATRF